MHFKEFLVYQEDYEIFSSLNEGEMLDALLAAPKFLAGTAGNLIGQNLRGVGNIGLGGAKSLYGAAQSGVGALQYLGGDKEAKKRAARKIKSGLSRTASGLGRSARGLTQVVASPITSILRGAQAIDDKNFGGVLAPSDPQKTYTQDLFGLSSGSSKPKPEENPKKIVPSKATKKRPTVKKAKSSPGPSNPTPDQTQERPTPTAEQPPQEYINLVDKLRGAKTEREGVAIAAELARKFPVQYAAAKKRALQLSRRRPSTNPSGNLRSGPLRRKPQGFGL